MAIIMICLLLIDNNKDSYKIVKLNQKPELMNSSRYTNTLVAVVNKKIILYDENGKRTSINTDFDVKLAYPLEKTVWVVDNNCNLYEISYSSDSKESYEVVLTDVAYINMAPEHYTAITNSGELYVWGDNIGYRLGLPVEGYVNEPTKIEGISSAKETAISHRNTIVLLVDGSICAAGEVYEKDNLEVVDNLENYSLVNELTAVERIYNSKLCVTLIGKQLLSWSHLYKDPVNDEIKMKQITSVDDFLKDKEAIYSSMGDDFTVYLTNSGELFYWGYDFLASNNCKCVPYAMPCKKIPDIEDVDMVYPGKNVVYAIKGNDIFVIK